MPVDDDLDATLSRVEQARACNSELEMMLLQDLRACIPPQFGASSRVPYKDTCNRHSSRNPAVHRSDGNSMDILTRSAKVRTPDVNKHHHDRCIVIALLETKVLGPTASLPQSIQPTFTSCGGDVLNNVRCLQLSTHVGIHCHESAPVHPAVLRIVSSPHFDGCLASSAFDE